MQRWKLKSQRKLQRSKTPQQKLPSLESRERKKAARHCGTTAKSVTCEIRILEGEEKAQRKYLNSKPDKYKKNIHISILYPKTQEKSTEKVQRKNIRVRIRTADVSATSKQGSWTI